MVLPSAPSLNRDTRVALMGLAREYTAYTKPSVLKLGEKAMLSRPLSAMVVMLAGGIVRKARDVVAAGSFGIAVATPFFWKTTSSVPLGCGTRPRGLLLSVMPVQMR